MTAMLDSRPPPTAEIFGDDGAVLLWAPATAGEPWRAATHHRVEPVVVEVAWRRRADPTGRSEYVCGRCGTGHRYDHCQHTRAAVAAARLWTEQEKGLHTDE